MNAKPMLKETVVNYADQKKVNVTDMVRSYAAVNGLISKKETKIVLGLSGDQVKRTFDTLTRQGTLDRVERGVYRFEEHIQKPGIDITDKIWRAMKYGVSFSAFEIAKLSGSTTSYVYKRFGVYRAEGFLKPSGVRRTYGSGTEKLWRLTFKGKGKAQNPGREAFIFDPLVMAAVDLNRLVCSGMVMRDKQSADKACALAVEIRDRIELFNK